MRKDFIKVLTERPRRGSGMRYHDVRPRDLINTDLEDEDNPILDAGYRYPYGWDKKDFSDLIGPLHRYLNSCVGRPWNDVHSEICENLKGRNTVQQHLLDHVKQEVDLELKVDENDRLYHPTSTWRIRNGDAVYGLYVDPRDGILKKAPERPRWRYREPDAPNGYIMEDGIHIRCDNGIWYAIVEAARSELVTIASVLADGNYTYYKTHPERKLQLNTKELKKYGVRNA